MYIKKFISKTEYLIFFIEDGYRKLVPNGEESPKVKDWLAKGNQFQVEEWQEPPLNELIEKKIANFKTDAADKLYPNDYKILRHLEQKMAGIPTTLSDAEFITLANERQAIRDRSNDLETQVMRAKTYDDIIKTN